MCCLQVLRDDHPRLLVRQFVQSRQRIFHVGPSGQPLQVFL